MTNNDPIRNALDALTTAFNKAREYETALAGISNSGDKKFEDAMIRLYREATNRKDSYRVLNWNFCHMPQAFNAISAAKKIGGDYDMINNISGIEILRQKMIDRGATKQQACSKTVDIVLKILAEESGLLDNYANGIKHRAEAVLAERDKILDTARKAAVEVDMKIEDGYAELRKSQEMIAKEKNAAQKDCEAYLAIKEQMEAGLSKEYADRLVLAEKFKEMVGDLSESKNGWDRAYYQTGLASILSGVQVSTIDVRESKLADEDLAGRKRQNK